MTQLIGGVEFIPENIELDESIYAAGRANRLVLEEGISFRDAYRRSARICLMNKTDQARELRCAAGLPHWQCCWC